MSFISLLQAAGAQGQGLSLIVTMVLMIAIFYFFLIRPQSKRQKETEKMLAALKKGDKVVTIGGIHGTITSVKENTVVLKVDDNAKIEFNRTAVASLEKSESEPPAQKKAEETPSEGSAEEAQPQENPAKKPRAKKEK